jgi:Domain of unknown function (DUF3943)
MANEPATHRSRRSLDDRTGLAADRRWLAVLLAASLAWSTPGAAGADPPREQAAAAPSTGPSGTPADRLERAPPPPHGDDTFRYLEPQVAHPWRAAGWIGLELSLHMAQYLLTERPPGPIYETAYTPWDKVAHGAVSFDANTFRTNFLGHPFMGASMYQLARGSREPAWLASLYALVGSTTWELIEFQEKASINDLVVTPVAGVALGEALFQLAAHLDRSPPSTTRTVLAWLAAPWKKVNDAIDGATPARGTPDDTLEARVAVGGAGVRDAGGQRGEARVSGGWRLWRDADFGTPGHATRAWLDGQASSLEASVAAGSHGVTDARFQSSALLAALYARALDAGGRGTDLVAGLGPGFELRGHAWSAAGPFDLAGLVEIPRGALEGRWLAGPARITLRLDAALVFGGSRSFALDGAPGAAPNDTLPTVQQQHGYHFGLGGSFRAGVELAAGPASLALAWRADALDGLGNPDPTPGYHPSARLEERWNESALRAAWRLGGWLELAADAGWRRRWSRADATTRAASERWLGAMLGAVE